MAKILLISRVVLSLIANQMLSLITNPSSRKNMSPNENKSRPKSLDGKLWWFRSRNVYLWDGLQTVNIYLTNGIRICLLALCEVTFVVWVLRDFILWHNIPTIEPLRSVRKSRPIRTLEVTYSNSNKHVKFKWSVCYISHWRENMSERTRA